jgi:hypothetical protein
MRSADIGSWRCLVGWENGAPAKEMCCGLKLVRKNQDEPILG